MVGYSVKVSHLIFRPNFEAEKFVFAVKVVSGAKDDDGWVTIFSHNVSWHRLFMGLTICPKRGFTMLFEVQMVTKNWFLGQQGVGYSQFGWEYVQPQDNMVCQCN
jgi:hypothetical protein